MNAEEILKITGLALNDPFKEDCKYTCYDCYGTVFKLETVYKHGYNKFSGIYKCLSCGRRYFSPTYSTLEELTEYIPSDYEPPEKQEKRELLEKISQLEERISRLEAVIQRSTQGSTPRLPKAPHKVDVIELPSLLTV